MNLDHQFFPLVDDSFFVVAYSAHEQFHRYKMDLVEYLLCTSRNLACVICCRSFAT
jgi:hypothetical protein